MISVQIDDSAVQKLQQRLSDLPPRFIKRVFVALRPLIRKTLMYKLDDHFAGWGPIGGSATNPTKLTKRTGNLYQSVIRSLQISESATQFSVSIGSDLPYAAIHEYGGYAGRSGPFKSEECTRPYIHPRPYLKPTIDDLADFLPNLLEEAIQKAQKSQ